MEQFNLLINLRKTLHKFCFYRLLILNNLNEFSQLFDDQDKR